MPLHTARTEARRGPTARAERVRPLPASAASRPTARERSEARPTGERSEPAKTKFAAARQVRQAFASLVPAQYGDFAGTVLAMREPWAGSAYRTDASNTAAASRVNPSRAGRRPMRALRRLRASRQESASACSGARARRGPGSGARSRRPRASNRSSRPSRARPPGTWRSSPASPTPRRCRACT